MSLAVSVIPIAMLLMAGIVVFIARRPVSAKKAANWPTNEATIRTVRIAYFGKNTGNPVYVGDFSYITGGEYYSGTLAISSSFSTGDGAPGDLVNQKIQVRYNPRKPKQFWVPQQEIRGFLLDPYMNSIWRPDVFEILQNVQCPDQLSTLSDIVHEEIVIRIQEKTG